MRPRELCLEASAVDYRRTSRRTGRSLKGRTHLKTAQVERKVAETMNTVKKFAIILVAFPLLMFIWLNPASAKTTAASQDFDAASVYKAKCVACHGAKAEKSFDAAKTDADLENAILKGVKPKMPAYETKGIDAGQSKALVAYMKSLKQ